MAQSDMSLVLWCSAMATSPPHAQNFPRFLLHTQFSRPFSLPTPQTLTSHEKLKLFYSRIQHRPKARAFREWKEYEEAVKRNDLAGALSFLKSVESSTRDENPVRLLDDSELARPRRRDLGLFGSERDWEVLDTCLNANDMRLVGTAYEVLTERGFLPNFGRFRNIVLEGPREVTPTVLKSSTGLEVSKLSPKKWGVSKTSSAVLITFAGGVSVLLSIGIDIRPKLAVVLGLAVLDSIFLGGCCFAKVASYWPSYKRRIIVHEAGHLLIAYLMGCPIRGVILDPIVALQTGIPGQAGTQFWDQNLESELSEGRLSGTAFDRYCMVLFAGIAAEALVYGEAEGGENDENLFRSICLLLQPPLSLSQMSNRARWSVMQAYNLLKWQKHAHRAAIKSLENGDSLSVVIRRIEEAMSSN